MFTNEKITQVAAYLLNKAGGKLNYTALLKLLYMADKRMLIKWGFPMTYDDWFAMPHGPVLSNTYNLIRVPVGYWGEHIRRTGYDVELSVPTGDDLLSEAEEQVINSIFEEHGGKTWKELVALTHGFAEWEDPQGSSIPMPYSQVLAVEGTFTKEQIDGIVRNIYEEKAIAELVRSTESSMS